jgi:hypothetical protein
MILFCLRGFFACLRLIIYSAELLTAFPAPRTAAALSDFENPLGF